MGNRKSVYSLVIDLDSFATKPKMQTEQVQKDRLGEFIAMAQSDKNYEVTFVTGYLNKTTHAKFRAIDPKISSNGISTSKLVRWDDLPTSIDVIVSPHDEESLSMLAPDHVIHINPNDINTPHAFLSFKKTFKATYDRKVTSLFADDLQAINERNKSFRELLLRSLYEKPNDIANVIMRTSEVARLLGAFKDASSGSPKAARSEAKNLITEYFQRAALIKHQRTKITLDTKGEDADLIKAGLRCLFSSYNVGGLYSTISTEEALEFYEIVDDDEFLENMPNDDEIRTEDYDISSDDFPVTKAHEEIVDSALAAVVRIVEETPRKPVPAP